jgi:uncharacterized protein (TIGR00255 family)
MIQSMTGYGSATVTSSRFHVSAEIKSLNSKYIEIYLKLPSYYFYQEIILKNMLTQKLIRGKVSVQLTIENLNPTVERIKINTDLLKAYYRQINQLSEALQLKESLSLSTLLSLPHVIQETNQQVDEEEWQLVQEAITQAANALTENRLKEGKALLTDLTERANTIKQLLLEIEPFEADRINQIKARMKSSLAELTELFSLSEDRFQQEVVYYLEKYDFNEEKVRLRAHLRSLFELLENSTENQGRKLQFLVQEMHREVNTLGVKAYDANIQLRVVAMKEEIEKLKEQLMNIV